MATIHISRATMRVAIGFLEMHSVFGVEVFKVQGSFRVL